MDKQEVALLRRLGRTLQTAREAASIDIVRVAQAVGLTPAELSAIEAGDVAISDRLTLGQLVTLEDELGIDLVTIL